MTTRLGADLTLEQIDDWFRIGKKVSKTETAPRSTLGGRDLDPLTGRASEIRDEPFVPSYKRHTRINNPSQTAYAAHYQQLEAQMLAKSPCQSGSETPTRGQHPGEASTMEALETESIISGLTGISIADSVDPAHMTAFYSNFNFKHTYPKNLPITNHNEQVLSTIESNQVTVIQGSTGSGKTTQVPQYILDHYRKENRYCNIIVTQPRRIAAMSIARRVCNERGWPMGTLCGYQVGMDRVVNDDTRLLYVTTGVLLQKLINTKNMQQYTHVILDEVHERDQDSDFCLLVVRKLLRTNSKHVKVVLMSATFDCNMFARYFAVPIRGQLEQAPIVSVEGEIFNVSEYYIEDLRSLGELPSLEADKPTINPEARVIAKKLIEKFDDMEIQEQGQAPNGFAPRRGTVLVFLPGLAEIQELDELLGTMVTTHKLFLLTLHSTITTEEQGRVFEPSQHGHRKVVLSTNIAESSITLADVKYVIDFCLTKNLMCDPETNYTSLQVSWASKANCTQRKGRAGRVSNGRVYRMITRMFWREILPEYSIPEMQRCPLEQLVLKAKILDMGEPKAILGLALSPPNLDDIERTVLNLKEVGALSSTVSGLCNPHDGDLTFLGRVLAQLPVDIRIGKLILMGHVFGLLDECVIIGASLSHRNFFTSPYRAYLEAYKSKLAWAKGSFSDCIAILNAYSVWENNKALGVFQRSGRGELEWGKNYMIQIRRIREVAILVKELHMRLQNFNIVKPRGQPLKTTEQENHLLLKVIFCAAFYPNYFVRGESDEQDAIRLMSGKDPFTTVMVKGLPPNQGTLYKSAVEGLFKCCGGEPRVSFEESRAFIEFKRSGRRSKDDGLSGMKILINVYLALKMRQLRNIPLEIRLYDAEEALLMMHQVQQMQDAKLGQRLRTNRIKAESDGARLKSAPENRGPRQVALPTSQQTIVPIYVTEILDCSHFWAQYADPDTINQLDKLMCFICNLWRTKQLRPMNETDIKPGAYCLAPFQDETLEYYRARIESVRDRKVQVFFMDYGNIEENIATDQLLAMRPDLLVTPFLAIECELCELKPSVLTCHDGQWTPKAVMEFRTMVQDKKLFAKIYSIVHGVMRVELIEKFPNGYEVNMNQVLLDRNIADRTEETYISKQIHVQREEEAMGTMECAQEEETWFEMPDEVMKGPSHSNPRGSKARLYGPYNPYEMEFFSMTYIGRLRAARIERESVNSVALDDEPHDKHARMMVAAHVGLNPSGSTMMARHTTHMPHIHGLNALVSLLFCPTCELRTNQFKKMYTGALCGLGWDPETGESALQDHDMEITFDTQLTNDDLLNINSVRMAINLAVGTGTTTADYGPDAMRSIQITARKKLLALLQVRRKSIEPCYFERPYRWNQVKEEDVLPHNVESMGTDSPPLLTLHNGIFLQEEGTEEMRQDNAERRNRMRHHLHWLHSKIARSNVKEEIMCELCNVTCHSPRDLMLHLETRTHRDEERLLFR